MPRPTPRRARPPAAAIGLVPALALVMILATAPAVSAAAPEGTVSERVRRAAGALYVHGMTAEIAQREVGPEGVPELLVLLRDPRFARRDNVVAILAYLGDGAARAALLAHLDAPAAALARPEEDRAALLVGEALGRMAARGDDAALDALLRMTAPRAAAAAVARAPGAAPGLADDLAASALRGLALARRPGGRDLAPAAQAALDLLRELDAPPDAGGSPIPAGEGARGDGASDDGARGPGAQSVSDEVAVAAAAAVAALAGTEAPPATEAMDTQTRVHEAPLAYANHAGLTGGQRMDDARLDTVLKMARLRMGKADYAGDVACCATLARSGAAKTFGAAGDGLDAIDTDPELRSVLNNNVARVKVVRQINYCGSSGTNIIGCAWTPGNGMALVRMSDLGSEAVLWAHEYGHNTGLSHATDTKRIMYGTDFGTNNGLDQAECNTYHAPSASSGMTVKDVGACADPDADEVHSVVDNCPAAANATQADGDADAAGDACDNCPSTANADQLNTDGDAHGNVCDADDDNDGAGDGADCAPLDGSASARAGRADGLGFQAGSRTVLTWTRGAQAAITNVYRNLFGPSFPASWSCLQAGIAGTSATDAAWPGAGKGYSYLVTGENVCGESDAGTSSAGATRGVAACP